MQLEEYFDFRSPTEIRIRGHRIGIEHLLIDYLEHGMSAEELAARYDTLSLDEVYATLTYYWRNRDRVDDYLRSVDEESDQIQKQAKDRPSAGEVHLRKLMRQGRARRNGKKELVGV